MENTNVNVLKEMYTKLFNEVTDALEQVEALKEKLVKAQQQTEEIYIENWHSSVAESYSEWQIATKKVRKNPDLFIIKLLYL